MPLTFDDDPDGVYGFGSAHTYVTAQNALRRIRRAGYGARAAEQLLSRLNGTAVRTLSVRHGYAFHLADLEAWLLEHPGPDR